MKKFLPVTAAMLCLCLCMTTALNAAQYDPDLVLVTGEHWLPSSMEQKNAYLFGIGNMIELEQAMHGEDAPSEVQSRSMIPVLVQGLKAYSFAEVREKLSQWYEQNPDQRNRPVLEVLYIELALPNTLSASK